MEVVGLYDVIGALFIGSVWFGMVMWELQNFVVIFFLLVELVYILMLTLKL